MRKGCLIGCGHASAFHLTGWQSIETARICAVSSRDENRAAQRAAQFHVPRYYTDYRQMLDVEKPDFVDIATPPQAHMQMIRDAASRGCDVLCQKPISTSLEELREMIRVCEDASVRFMVNENGRFQPWIRRMAELIASGEIGEVFYARCLARKRRSLPELTFVQADLFRTMPRLILFELGTHMFDILRYLLGEAHTVYAQIDRRSPHLQGEDRATAMARFAQGLGLVDLSWATVAIGAPESRASWAEYDVEGDGGTMHLDYDGTLSIATDARVRTERFPPDSVQTGYTAALRHFTDCLRDGSEFETSGRQTYRTMELVFAAYDSSSADEAVRVGSDEDSQRGGAR